ncbi:hypothetical protein ILUMI_00821 [Ignelater luminosus]|uniref:Uncharacterized protein n=1 Tax=Ignelater luminosus TaxID=2038154 RepID=A0A8K0DKV7_IGNLU|nr:hypothetical protein ILUMI_00821 [Ignelater luminosus]
MVGSTTTQLLCNLKLLSKNYLYIQKLKILVLEIVFSWGILHCSSSPSTTRAVEIINSVSFSRFDDENPTNATNLEDENDIYATIPEELTEFSSQIVAYISGFVVRKLFKVLKCEDCLDVLINYKNHPAPLIALRDKGGLINILQMMLLTSA